MTVTFLDPALCAYIAPGGGVARLAGGGAATEAPTVTITTSTFGAVTDATLNLDGPTASVADLANARWRVTPNPAGYSSKTTLTGPVAVFKHDNGDGGTSEVSVKIPRLDGGPDIEASASVTRATRSVSGMLPRTTTRGNETLKVEAAFGFETARSGLTCRLVRTASPGIPTERTIIETRTVDFPAGTGVALTREITFPPATGLGAGYEFHWEVDVAPGQRVVSKSMPMWVLGDDPRCAPQSLDVAPDALNYPAIYTRKASDSGVVTPAPGRTYQQHLDKFYYDWRADNLSSPVGGAWLSFNDYNSNIYWVDLDDPTVPKHRVEHWDVWQMGYVYPGWYGEDPWASPYPRNHVAVDVPIPHNASPSVGTDRSLCIVGLRNGQVEKIWEMWLAIKMADATWQAANIAVTTAADDWRHSRSYTVAAVGISALAYALRVKEAKAAIDYIKARRAAGQPVLDSEIIARIPHALAINIPRPYVGKVSYPGTFTDGSSSDTAAMWEGQLVYLRSDIDVSSLNLSPLHHAIRVVGKHRGYRVTDQTAWSTTMIVEGDQAYGGGVWSAMLEPNESWKVIIPKDHFIIGKQYETKAAFDTDTISQSVPDVTTSFTGLTDGAAWPAPWIAGQAPAGSTRDVQGESGRLVTASALGNFDWADASSIRLDHQIADFDATFRLRSYGQGYPRFVFRSLLPELTHQDCIYLAAQVNTSNPSESFRLDEAINWTQTRLARTTGAWPTGEWVRVRVRAEGARVRMRRWDDGAAEPTEWGIDQTVARTVPGHLGFIVGAAATATGYRADVDDFTLTDLSLT